MLEKKLLTCDLCVVGGGIAGMSAAVAAAREGAKVVLVHERPVLGGNASSEIRMCISTAQGENNRETGLVEEIFLENLYRNPTKSFAIWDTVLYDMIRREENITLLLNCTCMDAETEEGEYAYGRTRKIRSVTGYQMTTQRFYEVRAAHFCDSSGDSILAPLTGAQFRLGREARGEFGEDTSVEEADSMTMGMSCLIQGRQTHEPVKFIPPTWSTPLTHEDFQHRNADPYHPTQNYWYLELGGDRDTIGDTEQIRDELLGLAAGTWNYIKNSGRYATENWDLDFLGFLPGKRESRRMCGEYMMTQRDICGGTVFEDEVAFGGWPVDDHFPGGFYHKGVPNTDFKTKSPYSIPYRALYSKNVDNLYFAGRNISMTHMAMSSIRIMGTCSLLGAAVGKAASIAAREGICPHDVYLKHMKELQNLLMNSDHFLPSQLRQISQSCKAAQLSAGSEVLRNGQDRPNAIYGTDSSTASYPAAPGEEITYRFPEQKISAVHITFDSDLQRDTLPGHWVERQRSTRFNLRLDSPQMHMPYTLCRSFTLYGICGGEKKALLKVEDNRQRAWHIPVEQVFDGLVLIPETVWGDGDRIPVISFDFA